MKEDQKHICYITVSQLPIKNQSIRIQVEGSFFLVKIKEDIS